VANDATPTGVGRALSNEPRQSGSFQRGGRAASKDASWKGRLGVKIEEIDR
jgi:hypothetical protein